MHSETQSELVISDSRNGRLDVVVVGAGPCGLAAAIAAKDAGLSYTVLDRGCITNSLIGYPYYMTFFSTAERLEVGRVPFTIPEPKPTRRDALAYYRHVVDHHDLVVCQYEEVTAITRGSDGAETANAMFAIRSRRRDGSERRIVARAVVIATGGFGDPNQLDLSGGASAYPDRIIHYYREPYPFFGQDVVVVGGGNSAVESALELYRNGVRVCMVHFADVFDRGVKPWVRPDIDNRVASGEIPMHWNSRVAAVGAKTVTIVSESTGVRSEAPADWVLAMTGWRPDRTLLNGLGVPCDAKTGIPVHDPSTMETSSPGVYIAGVIAAGYNANKIFIENGREHGALIAGHLRTRLGARQRRPGPSRAPSA